MGLEVDQLIGEQELVIRLLGKAIAFSILKQKPVPSCPHL